MVMFIPASCINFASDGYGAGFLFRWTFHWLPVPSSLPALFLSHMFDPERHLASHFGTFGHQDFSLRPKCSLRLEPTTTSYVVGVAKLPVNLGSADHRLFPFYNTSPSHHVHRGSGHPNN
jgi:hypothetical protein